MDTMKGDLIERIDTMKGDLIERMSTMNTDLIVRTSTKKIELVQWMIGLLVGFSAIIITSIWGMLNFAIKSLNIMPILQEIISKMNP